MVLWEGCGLPLWIWLSPFPSLSSLQMQHAQAVSPLSEGTVVACLPWVGRQS